MEKPDRTTNAARDVLKGAGRMQRFLRRGISRSLRHGMTGLTHRHRSPVGTAPGTLISHPEAEPPVIRYMAWGPGLDLEEGTLDDVGQLEGLEGRWPVLWINVDGVGHADSMREIGEIFDLHSLALEDVMNVHQRAKVEEYPDHVFVVARMALFADGRLDTEQLSLFLRPGLVLTFQERPTDPFEPVRERARSGRGRLLISGADYLAYAILDAVIDGFYPVLQAYGDLLEELEAIAIDDPQETVLGRIHQARRDVLHLRHAIWPMRDAMSQLYRDPSTVFQDETRLFLRDAYDHTVQVMDLLENFRETASGLLDVYLSSLSHRMNEVMKVLTIIATIFIPLTFIAGIYGMNFDPEASPWNMPELSWYWGYPTVMVFMFLIGLVLLGFFRWKRWL